MNGISVKINNKEEYNIIKSLLGGLLYIDFVPQMMEKETSIVIYSEIDLFSIGSVGSSEYQKDFGFKIVDFKDYFKIKN